MEKLANPGTEKRRCSWVTDVLLREYHDNEYGRLKTDDSSLFEKLCLESFQAGLSWRTVLAKRDAFREVFFGFDIQKCAELEDGHLESLMLDPRIIRNRRKIFAVRENVAFLPQGVWICVRRPYDGGSLHAEHWNIRGARAGVLFVYVGARRIKMIG